MVGFAFVAAVELATAGGPGHGAFDGPAVSAAAGPSRCLRGSWERGKWCVEVAAKRSVASPVARLQQRGEGGWRTHT